MRFADIYLRLLISAVVCFAGATCLAQDVLQPHDGLVKYKLSNLREEKGITNTVIAFDYRRTREGTGKARLVVRTDQGTSRILGLPIRIEESGTIRLRDMFGRSREILNRGNSTGMEFYFVVDAGIAGLAGITYGNSKQYLVSNSVQQGTMSTKVKTRPLNKKELEAIELERKAKSPPETVPDGYVRSTNETPLVPGAPIMFGSVGKWKPGVVVGESSSSFIRVKPDDSNQIRPVRRQDWIAVSRQTLQQLESNPSQFSIDIRTLPGGNLVLDEDVQPLKSAMSLLKGTPLMREKYGKWEDAYLISSDDVSVRALIRERRGPRVEFIPLKELAIRKQTLDKQSTDAAKEAFAANVADFENKPAPLSGKGGTMASAGLAPTGLASKGTLTDSSAATSLVEPKMAPARSWSDKTGKFNIEARLVKRDEGKVLLKRTDGSTVAVPIDKLSDADQTYLKEQESAASEENNPFNNVVDSPMLTKGGNYSPVDYSRLMQPIAKVSDLKWGGKSVAISPQNQFLMIGRKGSAASLVEIKSGRTLIDSGRMDHMGDVGVCAFTPDGQFMVMGGSKGVIEVYEVDAKGKLDLKGQYPLHNKEITSLALSSDSKFALSGDSDKAARYWKLADGQPIATIDGFDGKVKATRISPSGNQLLATDGKTLKAYSVKEKKIVGELEVARSHASGQSAAISADGLLLAAGDGYDIHLWDLAKRQKLGTMEGKEINWSMTFAPDNRHLFSGGNGAIYVWDCERRMKLQTNLIGKSFYVQALAVSPDGTHVASPSAFSEAVVLQAGK